MPTKRRDDVLPPSSRASPRPRLIEVARIRPEDGLGRKRDKDGHAELCRSIEQFGVLTPITVRPAPDESGDYLLIKGQGRTLACRLVGVKKIPAVVVDDTFAETEKVQRFLVENVARLRMRPIDRALLIAHARKSGEETAKVAKRFGVAPSTVRRLEAQLDGATSGEVEAIRAGGLNLSVHGVIARHVSNSERTDVIRLVSGRGINAKELESLLVGLDWASLIQLGTKYQAERLALLRWACETLTTIPRGEPKERLRQLALKLPTSLSVGRAIAR